MLLPTSADRRPLCDLQLGGLEPAVGVWSGLGRARLALDTSACTKLRGKVRAGASSLKVLEITAMGANGGPGARRTRRVRCPTSGMYNPVSSTFNSIRAGRDSIAPLRGS